MTESRGARDASGITERLAEAGDKMTWQDLNEAYDRATVSWLSVYGSQPFERVKPHIEDALRAMSGMQWVSPGTRVSTAMLDARGDFAQRLQNDDGSPSGCRVQINIDDAGSSPVLRALGGKSSSIAFLAAHELAHCRFDFLSDDDRLPTQAMLMELGMPLAMAQRADMALRSASSQNGSDAFLDSYDEALADAAATIALVRSEKQTGKRFGSALDRARAMRLGMLHMSHRRQTVSDAHQGGFVFDRILGAAPNDLDWDLARRAAIQSVLWSNAYVLSKPRWWDAVINGQGDSAGSGNLTRGAELLKKWSVAANKSMLGRSAAKDEDVFISASSPAMFTVTLPDASSGIQSQGDAERLWKKFGWFTVSKDQEDSKEPVTTAR